MTHHEQDMSGFAHRTIVAEPYMNVSGEEVAQDSVLRAFVEEIKPNAVISIPGFSTVVYLRTQTGGSESGGWGPPIRHREYGVYYDKEKQALIDLEESADGIIRPTEFSESLHKLLRLYEVTSDIIEHKKRGLFEEEVKALDGLLLRVQHRESEGHLGEDAFISLGGALGIPTTSRDSSEYAREVYSVFHDPNVIGKLLPHYVLLSQEEKRELGSVLSEEEK